MNARHWIITLILLLISLDVSALSLNAAVRQVQQETGGKVLAAKTIEANKGKVHKIKVLLPNGRVKTFMIPKDS